MRVLCVIAFALLQSQVAVAAIPTYDDLKSQLPIQLKPNGGDQYFFFIVPVQRNDEPNILLQMAQVQDATADANSSVLATRVNTQNESIYSTGGETANLNEVFETPPVGPSKFNFQVPVIVPMDFRFTYNHTDATDQLPACTVDTRTWREQVITKIAQKLELDGEYEWDHTDLTVRIRLRKDALAGITKSDITSITKLQTYASTLVTTKTLSDIRYTNLLNNVTVITGGHVSIAAEGVDTYQMLVRCAEIAKAAADDFTTDPTTVNTIKEMIDLMATPAFTSLAMFQQLLIKAKALQAQEAEADEIKTN